jgi:hypothetical protein
MTQDEILRASLTEAANHFKAADEALKRGDLAGYQTANEAARVALERAAQALG